MKKIFYIYSVCTVLIIYNEGSSLRTQCEWNSDTTTRRLQTLVYFSLSALIPCCLYVHKLFKFIFIFLYFSVNSYFRVNKRDFAGSSYVYLS